MIFTKIAVIMALACAVARAQQPTTDYSDPCSGLTTCVMCTVATGVKRAGGADACVWSTEQQSCEHATTAQTAEAKVAKPAMVHDPAHCPRFDVIGNGRASSGVPYAYRVNVSNDAVAGLVSYLGRAGFTCLTSDDGRLHGRVEIGRGDGGVIACDPVTVRSTTDDGEPTTVVRHFDVVFGPQTVTLRLDHVEQNYVTFYDRDCSGSDDGCVDCGWTANEYKYYVKRCSKRNTCVGPFEYYDRRQVNGVDGHVMAWTNGVRTECKHAITVKAFDPTEAPRTATTVIVTVTVKNHKILAEDATVNVTVAGRACENPQTLPDDEETLTCTVSAAVPAEVNVVGPVRVTYAARGELTVESAGVFRFVGPAVTDGFVETTAVTDGFVETTAVTDGFVETTTVTDGFVETTTVTDGFVVTAAVTVLMAGIGYVTWLRHKKKTAARRTAAFRPVQFSDVAINGDK